MRFRTILTSGAALVFLAGCSEEGQLNLFKPESTNPDTVTAADNSIKLVERDVEAPEVFQVADDGLWDGRPSLGGVWVAHPDVTEPERVIIRNEDNSKFVIGALFRRERDNPGPILQVSSDAAAALGMLAGAPVNLSVTALRREEAPDPAAALEASVADVDGEGLSSPESVETSTLEPLAGAAAAIEAAESSATETAAAPAAVADIEPTNVAVTAAAATIPKPASSSLDKPFIQIGIFSVEQNAKNTAVAMRQAGMVPTVLAQNSQGKPFWRVIVGPAQSSDERKTLLNKIKGVGFDDAYPVTN
ncbi:MAG: SPOR domain-containing protein [Pseudomonadota bacterium]